ncbi:hypothetical protein SAMN05444397_101175 [Flavobacterium aquidurense]|uniref:Uncharacterized protein n=1 Tax=Flavobacterium frigidimaris TaxID=262320 RepID=A0ABX4BPZ3_FLAFR|nr:hypothetical protein [Flavobacterium frigidimaris]OXA78294.1 hypothetical protein B0A65_14140 [Flavobacterium frigidimaris]SDY25808.1 hypothetical protein SAMN05444397_101175 [Flavobacterium aquidurense]
MKKLIIILFLFLTLVSFKSSDVKGTFKTKYTSNLQNEGIAYYRKETNYAFSLLKKQKNKIDVELSTNEKVLILSIAFPEVLRYDSYSDYLETSSNKILYVKEGKKGSDFSTGYFQMKPSFIEDLENYIANNENLKQYDWILIQKKDEKETRKERINRLGNFQWQLRYLKVFWHVAEYKYQNIDFKTTHEKIRFFATAYNYGFTKPDKEITKYQFVQKFSPGEMTDTKKFAFADFSIDFIKTYSYFFNQ